jgi:hypothetical protein
MAIVQNWTASIGNPMARGGAGDQQWMPNQRGIMDPDVERQAQAAELPHMLKQQRFNTLLPWLQGQMGSAFSVGGQSGPSPEISVGPTLNSQQVQQQVNAARAANDMATQGRTQGIQRQMGASGFGANSPLAMALTQSARNQNMATNTGNERDIRLGAAEMNAGQIFKTQMGREQQFASRQDEDIRRRTQQNSQYNALLSALSGLA